MESIRVRRLSLSARLVLALGSVLLPFVAAASLGVFYLLPALVAPLEEIIGEVTQELEPLRHAQFALLAAGMAAQRRSPAADGDLAHVRQRVERAFDALRAAPFAEANERDLTEAAWREWHQASTPHVAARGSDGDQTTAAQFAFHAERAAALLDEVYVPARLEMERSRARGRAAKTRSVAVTFAAFLGAFLVSLYAAIRIARPVIADIGVLQRGAWRAVSCRIGSQP